MPGDSLVKDLAEMLNFYGAEHVTGTPDFVLAKYLLATLEAYNAALKARETWHGRPMGADKT
jgi:hypothetical protein